LSDSKNSYIKTIAQVTMSTTTTLQNNVRLRVFLILVISIGIRTARTMATDSVQKATNILEINYVLYGTILICSLLPFKAAWGMAGAAALIAALNGAFVVTLGATATYRCISALHSGCIQSSPWSILTLGLAGILIVLDFYQSWNIYQILMAPVIVQSALQRIRILFAWALPFGWLVNAVLLYKSEWTFMVGLHIIADPTLIVMATSKERALLLVIVTTLLVSDAMAFILVNDPVARSAILAQIALATSAGLMIFMPQDSPTTVPRTNLKLQSAESRAIPVGKKISAENTFKQTQLRSRPKSDVQIRF